MKDFLTYNRIARKSQEGFTLIETLVAIFILALTIGALLTLTAGGFFTIRYAKNDIVASNLLQESLEYVRNSRDTAAQQPNATWSNWLKVYEDNGCTTAKGCIINPYDKTLSQQVQACTASKCPYLNYYTKNDKDGFYTYNTNNYFDSDKSYTTSFIRTVTFDEIQVDAGVPQIVVTARMDWLNGTNPKSVTQSIVLTQWNLQ